jgi:precorrin-3B methylase
LGEEIDGLVSYLSVGHPSVYSYTPSIVKKVGEEEWGLDVGVFPGVSTADKMFARLGVDPASNGVLQYPFSEAMRNELQISERVTFVGCLFGRYPHEGFDSHQVVNYLSGQYSRTTKVHIARFSKNVFNDDAVMELKVKDIDKYPSEIFRGTTIIIFGERHRELHREDNIFNLRSWNDEQIDGIKSGKPRNQKTDIEVTTSKLRERNEDDLIEFIKRTYEDDEFYRKVINETEEAVAEYDLPKDVEKAVLQKKVQKSNERIDALLNEMVPSQLGQDTASNTEEESESENN